MKKLLTILSFLIVSISCFSQSVQTNNSFLFQPSTATKTTLRVKGDITPDSGLRIPNRLPTWIPTTSGWITFSLSTHKFYYYDVDSAAWLQFGTGGGGGGGNANLYTDASTGLVSTTGLPYNGTLENIFYIDTSKIATKNFVNNFFGDTSIFFPANAQQRTNDPPASPADSTWWIIGDTPTGIWTVHPNQLAQRIGTGYAYYDEPTGTIVNTLYPAQQWQKISTSWEPKITFIINNGNLIGIPITVGTNDNQSVFFETHDTARIKLDSLGRLFIQNNPTFNTVPARNSLKIDSVTHELTYDTTYQLIAGTNITFTTDEVNKTTTISSTGGGGSITLQTNGVDNGSQAVLNLKQGNNMTITDDGSGGITFDAASNIDSLFGKQDNIASATRNFDLNSHDFNYTTGNISLTNGAFSVINSNSGATTEITASSNTGFTTAAILDNVNGLKLQYGNADGFGGIRRNSGNNAGITTIFSDSSNNNSAIEFVTQGHRDMLLDDVGNLYLNRLQSASTSNVLYYDATTKAVTYGTAPSGGSGTVTSVATGYGLSGGTITTSGTLIADTTSSTGLVSKDRLTNSLALKLNISDTASMLSHYVRGIVAGTNTTVDNTNPQYPVINASGGGGGYSDTSYINPNLFTGTDWQKLTSADSAARATGKAVWVGWNYARNSGKWIVENAWLAYPHSHWVIADTLKASDSCRDNIIRTANAGTGKTNVRANRYSDISIVGAPGGVIEGADNPRSTGMFNTLKTSPNLDSAQSYGTDVGKAGRSQVGDVRNIAVAIVCTDRVDIRGLKFNYVHAYGLSLQNCHDYRVTDIRGNMPGWAAGGTTRYIKNNGLTDFSQGTNDGIIENVTGFSADDAVALNITDIRVAGRNPGDSTANYWVGDSSNAATDSIYNIKISNVNVSTYANAVRTFVPTNGVKDHNVIIEHVRNNIKNTDPLYTHAGFYGLETSGVLLGSKVSIYGGDIPFGQIYDYTVNDVATFQGSHYCVRVQQRISNSSFNNLKRYRDSGFVVDALAIDGGSYGGFKNVFVTNSVDSNRIYMAKMSGRNLWGADSLGNYYGYTSTYGNAARIMTVNLSTALGNGALGSAPSTGITGAIAIGGSAGFSATNQNGAVYIGTRAGYKGAGNDGVYIGSSACDSCTVLSVAIGSQALLKNSTGLLNTAVGYHSLLNNTTASNNTAIGYGALLSNITGHDKTVVGVNAGAGSTGNYDTYVGSFAGNASNSLGNNTGVGYNALGGATGDKNTAVGRNVGGGNTSGANNSFFGFSGGLTNTTGSNNSTFGYQADVGSNNLTNATAVGANAIVSASNTIQLGNPSVTDVYNGTTATVHMGGLITNYVAKTTTYTITATDNVIEATSGTFTITLPTAVGRTGQQYYITNSGSGVITLATTSSQTFVNVSGAPTTLTINQFGGYTVISNGTNWLAK